MIREILTDICLLIGMAFCIASIVGMIRMPDYYSRCHASGNSETLGLMFPCIGLMISCGLSLMTLKLLLLFVIVFINNPMGTHVLGREAYLNGHPIWTKRE